MGEKIMKKVKNKLSEIIEVDEVYLFGSRAKGTFREDSDYDIAIISQDFEGRKFRERQEMVLDVVRSVIEEKPVEVVCYTPEEFENGKDGFLPEIIAKEGFKA